MRVVLDTNVVVSSYLTPSGPPGTIRDALEGGAFQIVVSDALLAEYGRALSYPRVAARHGLSEAQLADQLVGLRRSAVYVEVDEVLLVIPEDPADDMVFATAVAGSATYIVSGDDHLLRLGEYRGIQVIPPALFVTLLAP